MSLPLCPYCGETAETFPDPGGGEHQDYVEDCAVCCRPIRFLITYSEQDRDYDVVAMRES